MKINIIRSNYQFLEIFCLYLFHLKNQHGLRVLVKEGKLRSLWKKPYIEITIVDSFLIYIYGFLYEIREQVRRGFKF